MDLIAPRREYKSDFLIFLEGIQKEGYSVHEDLAWIRDHFETYLQRLEDGKDPTKVPEGWVASTTFWMVEQGQFVGAISFRHELNDALRTFGGHIGYGVAPKFRGKGYATTALRKVLDDARLQGHQQVLLTCDDSNLASRKVIENNGGALEGVYSVSQSPVPIRRYWIKLE